jgi:hypothetical protein
MVWLLQIALVASVFVPPQPPVHAQEPETPIDRNYEFVSGTISELPPGKIVVNRAVLGKPAEDRTFLITSETKIEGNLKIKARVTVGFKPSSEGDVALRIIVR